jgi:hypothetical protein
MVNFDKWAAIILFLDLNHRLGFGEVLAIEIRKLYMQTC